MSSPCRITMYGPAVYELQVQGRLDESWIGQMQIEAISITEGAASGPVTVLTSTFSDQAALRGMLDRIYNLNLPLISVRHLGNG